LLFDAGAVGDQSGQLAVQRVDASGGVLGFRGQIRRGEARQRLPGVHRPRTLQLFDARRKRRIDQLPMRWLGDSGRVDVERSRDQGKK
jgi:hypothetical protein